MEVLKNFIESVMTLLLVMMIPLVIALNTGSKDLWSRPEITEVSLVSSDVLGVTIDNTNRNINLRDFVMELLLIGSGFVFIAFVFRIIYKKLNL